MSEQTPTYGLTEEDQMEIDRRLEKTRKRLEKKASKGELKRAAGAGGGRVPADVPADRRDEYRRLRTEKRAAQEQRSALLDIIAAINELMAAMRGAPVAAIVMLLGLLGSSLAFAAEPAAAVAAPTASWWQPLVAFVLSNVLQLAGALLVVALGALAGRFKISLELDLVKKAVAAGVAYAEQLAASKLKVGQGVSSASKMADALSLAQSLLDRYKVRGWAEDKLKPMIEAALGAPKVAAAAAVVSTVELKASELKPPAFMGGSSR